MSTFSQRHGFVQPDAPIAIRSEAPDWLRSIIIQFTYDAGLHPSDLREMLCKLLLESPDASNWSEFPNIDSEVRSLLSQAEWFRVYDLIELVCEHLEKPGGMSGFGMNQEKLDEFARQLNDAFRRKGVGWQLMNGHIEIRGEESFEKSVRSAITATAETGRSVAQRELHEALHDLSKRPTPDISGAIQHGMAALECVARDVTGEPNATLGAIISRNPGLLPPPLDKGVEKIWGYASDQARHLREGKTLDIRDAELVVGLAGSIATYLIRKTTPPTSG
jgi:hypothetical protein